MKCYIFSLLTSKQSSDLFIDIVFIYFSRQTVFSTTFKTLYPKLENSAKAAKMEAVGKPARGQVQVLSSVLHHQVDT